MEFKFHHRVSLITRLTTITVFSDEEKVGVLRLTEDEWSLLQAILLHGRTWFMDNEATIVIEDV
jgi:hypothetical protein